MPDWLWPPPPDPLPDPVDEVHVWSIPIGSEARPRDDDLSLLDDRERERAGRFRIEHGRRDYVASHSATRRILARYLDAKPRALRFESGERGKPHLVGAPGHRSLHFNLSHSADAALLAVTRIGPLGVDVEAVRTLPDADDIAERFFARGERDALRRIDAAERAEIGRAHV